jgi:DNA uptake protein ComE-like DNA-binding protein
LLSLDEDPRLRRVRRRLAQRSEAALLARLHPSLAREAGIGSDADTFGGLIDVNGASAEELAELPGFDLELGRRIVEARQRIAGFDNVDDFANILDLPRASSTGSATA